MQTKLKNIFFEQKDLPTNNPQLFSYYLIKFFKKYKGQNINLDLNNFLRKIDKSLIAPFVNSLISSYHLVFTSVLSYKTKKDEIYSCKFIYGKSFQKYFDEANSLATAENFSRFLQLLPHNKLNAQKFIDIVLKEIKKNKVKNLTTKIFNFNQLQKNGFELITAVGKGSKNDSKPQMLVINYNTDPKKKKITLIGKGIIFDTGGISLKPSQYMQGMQYDMSGAAIVIGALLAIIKNKLKANISIICPLANNDIGENSFVVSDIYHSYDKKTSIEITNTDAEGRLILADAVSYAKNNLKSNTILTIATLTGAVEIAFGDVITPIWTTNKEQYKQLESSANLAGEFVWNMPFHPEYKKLLEKSNIADYINSELSRAAGSSVAATFINIFADPINFIHLDIAATSEYEKNAPCPVMLKTLYYFIKHQK